MNNISTKKREVIVVVTPSGNPCSTPTPRRVRTKASNGQPLNN